MGTMASTNPDWESKETARTHLLNNSIKHATLPAC